MEAETRMVTARDWRGENEVVIIKGLVHAC